MTGVVVDASTALAWCFPDETSEYADAVLVGLERHTILTPAVWNLELTNAVLVGERKERLRGQDIQTFITLLDSLSVVQDALPFSENMRAVLPVARAHGVSAYDAAYLELAIRHSAPLATLDRKLRKAADKAGVRIFGCEAA